MTGAPAPTPRQLAQLPLDLALYDTVKHGSAPLLNVKSRLGASWRRSIRAIGGYWQATADYAGPAWEMAELFLGGLGQEVRETVGGFLTWQGFLAEMELTLGGVTYTRRWLDLANAVQTIYTKLGDNLLTNGSVESGAWAAFNIPSTGPSQSTAWVADGTYSCYIENLVHTNSGAYLQQNVTIVAGQAYDCQVALNLVAGTWTLLVQQHGAGFSGGLPLKVLAQSTTNTTGNGVLRCSIPNSNTYAGGVDLIVYNPYTDGKAYFDQASFRISAAQARTAWYADTAPQAEYGTLQLALLQSSLSDAAANALAATTLAEQKWPRTTPAGTFGASAAAPADGLKLTFAGYAWSLRNKYAPATIAGTTQNASTHVANLVADSEFIAAGAIASNTFQYQVDDRAPLREWAVLETIAQAGDAAGNRWNLGVYANRLLYYQMASQSVDYHFRGGQLLNSAGGAMEPWLAAPGLIYLDDMPVGPGSLTANAADDPHVVFVEEVEFDAAAWLAGYQGLNLSLVAGADNAA